MTLDEQAGSKGKGTVAITEPTSPPRRPRPVLVELASALMVVGGAFNLLLSIEVLLRLGRQGGEIGLLTVTSIVLAVATIGLGLLVRYGHAWLVAVNAMAVLAFLELISGTPVGLLFGVIDLLIVLALARERPWFVWSAEERAEAAQAR